MCRRSDSCRGHQPNHSVNPLFASIRFKNRILKPAIRLLSKRFHEMWGIYILSWSCDRGIVLEALKSKNSPPAGLFKGCGRSKIPKLSILSSAGLFFSISHPLVFGIEPRPAPAFRLELLFSVITNDVFPFRFELF